MKKLIVFTTILIIILNSVIAQEEGGFDEQGYNSETGEVLDGGTLPLSHSGEFNCMGNCRLEGGGSISGSGTQEGDLITIPSGTLIIDGKATSGNFEYDFSTHSYAIIDGTHQFILISQASIKDTPTGFEGISTGDPTLVDGIEIKPSGTHFKYPPERGGEGINVNPSEEEEKQVIQIPRRVIVNVGGVDVEIGEEGDGVDINSEERELVTIDATLHIEDDNKKIHIDPSGSETKLKILSSDEFRITTIEGDVEYLQKAFNRQFNFQGQLGFEPNILNIDEPNTIAEGGWDFDIDDGGETHIDGVVGFSYMNRNYPGILSFETGETLEINGINVGARMDIENNNIIDFGHGDTAASEHGNRVSFVLPLSEELSKNLGGNGPAFQEALTQDLMSGLMPIRGALENTLNKPFKSLQLEYMVDENNNKYTSSTNTNPTMSQHSTSMNIMHGEEQPDEIRFYAGPELSFREPMMEIYERMARGETPKLIPDISIGGGYESPTISGGTSLSYGLFDGSLAIESEVEVGYKNVNLNVEFGEEIKFDIDYKNIMITTIPRPDNPFIRGTITWENKDMSVMLVASSGPMEMDDMEDMGGGMGGMDMNNDDVRIMLIAGFALD